MPQAERPHLAPLQRDLAMLFGSLALLLLGVAVGITYGVSFDQPGIAPWALALIGGVVLAFAAGVFWWYYVSPDERDPARGEFTVDAQHHVQEGAGSFRTKELHEGAAAEPEARLANEPGFVPRTTARWALWFLGIVAALVLAAVLVQLSRGTEDPFPALMAAMGLVMAAVVLGAIATGEMAHSGAWTRREPPRTAP